MNSKSSIFTVLVSFPSLYDKINVKLSLSISNSLTLSVNLIGTTAFLVLFTFTVLASMILSPITDSVIFVDEFV